MLFFYYRKKLLQTNIHRTFYDNIISGDGMIIFFFSRLTKIIQEIIILSMLFFSSFSIDIKFYKMCVSEAYHDSCYSLILYILLINFFCCSKGWVFCFWWRRVCRVSVMRVWIKRTEIFLSYKRIAN